MLLTPADKRVHKWSQTLDSPHSQPLIDVMLFWSLPLYQCNNSARFVIWDSAINKAKRLMAHDEG